MVMVYASKTLYESEDEKKRTELEFDEFAELLSAADCIAHILQQWGKRSITIKADGMWTLEE